MFSKLQTSNLSLFLSLLFRQHPIFWRLHFSARARLRHQFTLYRTLYNRIRFVGELHRVGEDFFFKFVLLPWSSNIYVFLLTQTSYHHFNYLSDSPILKYSLQSVVEGARRGGGGGGGGYSEILWRVCAVQTLNTLPIHIKASPKTIPIHIT